MQCVWPRSWAYRDLQRPVLLCLRRGVWRSCVLGFCGRGVEFVGIGDRTKGCASPRLIVYSATTEGWERASASHSFPNFKDGLAPSFLH